MPTVDLELQLKFLNQLNDALDDAITRYKNDPAERRGELAHMKQEVRKARKTVAAKLSINRSDVQDATAVEDSHVVMAG